MSDLPSTPAAEEASAGAPAPDAPAPDAPAPDAPAPDAPAPDASGDLTSHGREPVLLTEPFDIPWPASGIVRAVRRRADLSQRELARWAGVHHATIGRIEAGRMVPSIALLRRIIGVAGFRLAVVDEFGRVLRPMRDWQDTRDGAERRYPSHLDTILDPEPGEWWADLYGLARPPETFFRNRAVRDVMRRRSQWEVRVAKYRNVPPPPRACRHD